MSNLFDRLAKNSDPAKKITALEGSANHSKRGAPSDELVGEIRPAEAPVAEKRTISAVRIAVQELLKYGYLEEASRRDIFQKLLGQQTSINAILEPLDLQIVIDSYRGIAFLVIFPSSQEPTTENDAWAHPLVRRQRLTLEQSVLIAILRQFYVRHEQESGVGQADARITVEDLLPHYLTYFADTGSDAKNESKLLHLLDQLKSYGIVSEVDEKLELTVRPLIAHMANPESLATLLKVLQEQRSEEFRQSLHGDAELGDTHR